MKPAKKPKKSHVEDNLDFDYEKTNKSYPPGFLDKIISRINKNRKRVTGATT